MSIGTRRVAACRAASLLLLGCMAWATTGKAVTGGQTNHVWMTGGRLYSSPAISANGLIHVGSTNGDVYAFLPNGATQRVWHLPDKAWASPSIGANGTIYVGCADGNLYALLPNGATQHVWTTGGRIVDAAAISRDGTIYVGSEDGNCYAFNPNGTTQRVWAITGYPDILAPALTANGDICISDKNGEVRLLGADGTTQRTWSISSGSFYVSPVIGSNGVIYIGDTTGKFYAFDPDGTTQHVWSISGSYFYSTPAIGSNGTIYIGAMDKNFYAFDPNGTTQHVWGLANKVYSSPAIAADGTIYVGCDSGDFYALNPDGTTNIQWNLDGRIQASPAIGLDGTVYIGQYDGSYFYALEGTGARLANTIWPKFCQNMENTCRALSPPGGLAANNNIGTAAVTISWSNEPYATGYEVWRGTLPNPHKATLLGVTNGTSFVESDTVAVLTNRYWVRSTNRVFTSQYGTPATCSRPILPSTNVTASQGEYTDKTVVRWTSSPDAGTYRLFAGTNTAPAGAVMICETNALCFTDTVSSAGATFNYWVRVRLFGASSSWSPAGSGWRGAFAVDASDGAYTDAVQVHWDSLAGAGEYCVLRSAANDITTATELETTSATIYQDTTAVAGTYYYYWICATNASGLSSLSTADRGWRSAGLAPAAPTNVAASDGLYADKVEVTWSEANEANGYTVWRGTGSSAGDSSLIGMAEGESYSDTSAEAGTTYYYWLKATNSYGESGFSASNTGWKAAGAAPVAPAGLIASKGAYASKVVLTWSPVDSAEAYSVWRSTGGDSAGAVYLGNASGPSHADSNVTAEILYCYWVKATNSYGESAFSAGAWGWTGGTNGAPPVAPDNLTASAGTYFDRIRLSWDTVDGAIGYTLWRATTNDPAQASLLLSGIVSGTYDDLTAMKGLRYTYWVSASNEFGAGAMSIPAEGWARSPNAGAIGINDYNGDGKADLAIFDNRGGQWYIMTAAGALVLWADPWGWPGAIPVPGDYNGDGLYDQAVFDNNTGKWYIKTLDNKLLAWEVPWGWPGAEPVWGDYDGDGKSDLTVFDQNTGYWYSLSLSKGPLIWAEPWGWPGAIPVPGDYNGNGKSDLTVFDNNSGNWFSMTVNKSLIMWAEPWGWPGAITVPGDYDGDDIDDMAVFDNNTGNWYILSVAGNGILWARSWGWPGAIPVPGDYDGNGKSDLAVFDNNTGNWFILRADGGLIAWALPWGYPSATVVGGRH
ncbi:MAG: PQQ-binding-like beta-propeller repeat protein [Lentisphaerae bacterium]|nr:PQQ-binding-like beta-propeller repeat protein [Lentisphaerota bacterium]